MSLKGAAAAEAAGGGPEDPVADAVAGEQVATAKPAPSRTSEARQTASTAYQVLPGNPSNPEPWDATIIRIIFAFAVGLIALELGSIATGRYFNWNLKTGWKNLQGAGNYVGITPVQTAASHPAQAAAPATSTPGGHWA